MEFLYEAELRRDKNGRILGIWLDGEKVPSVTRVLRILDKPALKSWAWRIAVEGSATLPVMRRTTEQQTEALIRAGYGWWQVRDQKAKRGKDVHDALRHLLEQGTPPDLDEWPEEQHGFVQALADYWIKERPVTLAAERVVASRRYKYAGIIDLIRAKGQLPCVVDFKTGKPDDFGRPREPFLEADIQVAALEQALEENLGSLCAPGEIVALCDNGTYEIFPSCASPEGFKHLIATARYIRQVEDAKKQWRKQQEEAPNDPTGTPREVSSPRSS